MKVVAKPIEVVSWTDKEGNIHPIRFRYENKEEEYVVIKINRIIYKSLEKLCGNPMMIYRCVTTTGGTERIFEIKYALNTCKWMLFKI